jgi:hypothetical protein
MDVYDGKCNDAVDTDEAHPPKGTDEIYRENAAAVAFLLVENLIDEVSNDNVAIYRKFISMEGITVALEAIHGESTFALKCVSVLGGYANGILQISLFYSLAEIFLKLFTRNEFIPDWFSAKGSSSTSGNEDEWFEVSTMQDLFLHNDADSSSSGQSQKHYRQMESNTSSKLRNQYSTLPIPICRLIADLVDGSNSDVSRTNTAFTSINHVLDDLKQMVIEPDVFLHDAQGSNRILDFKTRLYGRKEEISHLLYKAERIQSKRNNAPLEVISIRGYSGSGKSSLVRRVGRYLSGQGWFFLRGKFDRMPQNDAFAAIVSPFEDFCSIVQGMKDRGNACDVEYCTRLSRAVKDSLGRSGIRYLSRVIPSLSQLFNDRVEANASHNIPHAVMDRVDSASPSDLSSSSGENIPQNAVEASMSQRRLELLLFSFVEKILALDRPILLFYDDVQWADASTLDFLGKFLKNIADHKTSRANILYVQCYRDNEVEPTDPLPHMVSTIASHDCSNLTQMQLEGFSQKALNTILSAVLHLPCRITSSLSVVIHQKTRGNMLFCIEFIKSLQSPEKKLLRFSLSDQQWIWDADSISLLPISGNVAGLLMNKLLRMSKNVLNCLSIASCFGSQVNSDIITLLDGLRGATNIIGNLESVVNEGLLERAGPLFVFAHDSIQEIVYEMTPQLDIIQLHVDIGSMLISKSALASPILIGEVISRAVGQINMALPKDIGGGFSVEFSLSQRIVFAKLNLRVSEILLVHRSYLTQP